MGVSQYVADMLKVTAWQPRGRDRIKLEVASKDPQVVEKSLALTPVLMEGKSAGLRGKDMSCTIRRALELGLV